MCAGQPVGAPSANKYDGVVAQAISRQICADLQRARHQLTYALVAALADIAGSTRVSVTMFFSAAAASGAAYV